MIAKRESHPFRGESMSNRFMSNKEAMDNISCMECTVEKDRYMVYRKYYRKSICIIISKIK